MKGRSRKSGDLGNWGDCSGAMSALNERPLPKERRPRTTGRAFHAVLPPSMKGRSRKSGDLPTRWGKCHPRSLNERPLPKERRPRVSWEKHIEHALPQ